MACSLKFRIYVCAFRRSRGDGSVRRSPHWPLENREASGATGPPPGTTSVSPRVRTYAGQVSGARGIRMGHLIQGEVIETACQEITDELRSTLLNRIMLSRCQCYQGRFENGPALAQVW